MRHKSFLFMGIAAVLLAGCGVVGEERSRYFQRDWERFKNTDWFNLGGDVTGFNEAFPSPRKREIANEQKICLHQNSQNRVVTQNGVNDEFVYRRCPLAPYDSQSGSRMGNRPDGNGTVLR